MRPDLTPADPVNTNIQIYLRIIALSLVNDTVADALSIPLISEPQISLTTIWVQSLLYASLSCSLFAALGAVLGKQWLSYYMSVEERGTVVARGKDRQRKFTALHQWGFRYVLELLPILLQVSLLLFGLALCAYMWNVQRTVAVVLIVVNAVGALLYFGFVFAPLFSQDCPFHTPQYHMTRQLLHAIRDLCYLNFIWFRFFGEIILGFLHICFDYSVDNYRLYGQYFRNYSICPYPRVLLSVRRSVCGLLSLRRRPAPVTFSSFGFETYAGPF